MDNTQIQAELAELAGKMQVVVQHARAKTEEVSDGNWQHTFGDITPMQLYRRFEKVAGRDNEVKLDIVLGEDGFASKFHILHNTYFDAPENYLTFFLRTHDATLDQAQFIPSERGKVAKQYLYEAVQLFKELGMNKLDMTAARVGGYAWIKYGFLPSLRDWDELKGNIRSRMYPQNQSASYGGTIRYGGKYYPIEPEEFSVIRRVLSDDSPREDLVHLTALNRVIAQSKYEPDLTVGKALLMHHSYDAELPLQDGHPQYERFKAYTQDRGRTQQADAGARASV